MKAVHPASLVEPSLHSKAMFDLLELEIGRNMIEHLVCATLDTVDFATGVPSTSYVSRGRSESRSKPQNASSFTEFVSNVVTRSEVTMGVLLVALVYIERSKPHLTIATEDWARERVFLGALILAAKYTNDSTLKNTHWSLVTGVFGKRDIGRVEREFLDVLDWELSVTEEDILEHYDSVMALYRPQKYRKIRSLFVTNPTRRRRPSSQTEEACSDSDSDSEYSSPSTSPSPETPSTSPHRQPIVELAPTTGGVKDSPHLFHLSQFFSLMAKAYSSPPSPVPLPRVEV